MLVRDGKRGAAESADEIADPSKSNPLRDFGKSLPLFSGFRCRHPSHVFVQHGVTMSGQSDAAVLVVRPKRACEMLSIGQTRLFELLGQSELESFKDGGGRWITTRSIHAYVQRQLERSQAA